MSAVTFTPIGGGTEIGANSYRLDYGDFDIIIDSGLHPKKEGQAAHPRFDLLTRAPAGLIISHAHIDHCGTMPLMMKHQPNIPCYATKPTVRIMDRMLHNSVSVMTTIARERRVAGYPAYTHQDVEAAMRRTVGFDYHKQFMLSYDCPVRAEFRHAGHVLGSASIILHHDEHTVMYTGDVCATDQQLMAAMEAVPDDLRVDTLIIESTRGAHVEDYPVSYEDEIKRFSKEIANVVKGGGVALIPAFALGRMQELLNVIHEQQQNGVIPVCDVYASGLGRAVYEVYARYTEYLKPDAGLASLLEFEAVGDVWDPNVRRKLLKQPAIIVATSGMMIENTPSSMLAMDMVKEERHGIFFVGYLDPDTLGYKVLHAKIGDTFPFTTDGLGATIALENRQRFHFSGHAPREDLCAIIDRVNPKNVVFTHGDPEAIDWMVENVPGNFRKAAASQGESLVLES